MERRRSTARTAPAPLGRAMSPFLSALAAALGDDAIHTGPDDLSTYGRDWTKVHTPAPSAVVFPRSIAHVVTLVRLANEHRVALVPSGGRTGLAAGAVAAKGEVVVSFERMRAMGPVDRAGLTVRVEAGAVTEAVHQHVEPLGVTWPVDFASKGSSTVGGNIATNAGGVKVIRWGLTRSWVLGLEVVTGAGELLTLNGALEKNNTGIDLRQLFIGSEGTLGIVCAATLKLVRLPGHLDVFFFALPSLPAVLTLLEHARSGPFVLTAFEVLSDVCHRRVQRHRGLELPLATRAPYYVLCEVEAHDRAALDGWLAGVVENELVLDGTLAQSATQAKALWQLRESISESLSATGFPHKNDVALPIAELPAFVDALETTLAVRWPGFEVCIFGHVGDGNLHVNVMRPDGMAKEEFLAHAAASDVAMFELVQRHRGSVSAEHGIGLLKKAALRYSRTPEEIALFRGLKGVLDPNGILNPGKIWD
jgi:FAD/FMN-containing dehydrogenase